MVAASRLIYGVGDMARLVYRIAAKNGLAIDGFCVEPLAQPVGELCGLPVRPFDEVLALASRVELYIAVGPVKMNQVRERIFRQAKAAGMTLPNFVCASVYQVEPLQLGEGNIILNGCCLHSELRVGDNNLLASGVTLGHDVVLGSHCFFAGAVTVAGKARIGDRCFLGLGATVGDNLSVGDACFIGQGAVLTRSAEAGAVYIAPAARKQPFDSARFCDMVF